MYKLEDSFDLETKVVEREYLIKIKEEIIRITRGYLLRDSKFVSSRGVYTNIYAFTPWPI